MKDTLYRSTRSNADFVSASKAILEGIAPDGGLYVPDHMPKISDMSESLGLGAAPEDFLSIAKRRNEVLKYLADCDYKKIAFEVLKLFFTDFDDDEILACVDAAYDNKFDTQEIALIVKKGGVFYLELFHGPTLAFKDMALSLLPHLITASAKKQQVNDEIVILTATSGDTGKAALSGFADVPGTKIIVFYPNDGVSSIQKLQMVTQPGSNVKVIGIEGNFDDAQTGVKSIFADKELNAQLKERGYRLSSANSINIGRLIPQVAYYVWAYTRLVSEGVIAAGTIINLTVPTGNFGNILAAYYAKQMGVPIKALVCASNKNKVLYDFFTTGTYDKNREFYTTSSPSMDILVSSNLERLIFEITGNDPERCSSLMNSLKETGEYTLSAAERFKLRTFTAAYASEEDTLMEIKRVYNETGYVIDPHTAVASSAANYFDAESVDLACGTTSDFHMLVVATASPFKFNRAVLSAIAPQYISDDDFSMADSLSLLAKKPVPEEVKMLKDAPILHKDVCTAGQMKDKVLEYLN